MARPSGTGWGQWYLLGLVAQSSRLCATPMGCGQPGSSVQGILQARAREWVAMSCSDSFRPSIKPTVKHPPSTDSRQKENRNCTPGRKEEGKRVSAKQGRSRRPPELEGKSGRRRRRRGPAWRDRPQERSRASQGRPGSHSVPAPARETREEQQMRPLPSGVPGGRAHGRAHAHSPQFWSPDCRPAPVRARGDVPAGTWRAPPVAPAVRGGPEAPPAFYPSSPPPPPPARPFPTRSPLPASRTPPSGLLVSWCFPLKS